MRFVSCFIAMLLVQWLGSVWLCKTLWKTVTSLDSRIQCTRKRFDEVERSQHLLDPGFVLVVGFLAARAIIWTTFYLCAGAGAILYFIWPVVSSLPRVSQVSNCAINFSVGFCICSTWPNVYYFAGDFSDLFCRDKSLRQCACAKGPHSIIINNTSTTTNSIINSSSTSALLHCMAMHNNKRIVGMKWQKAVVHFHHSRWKRENDQKMCMFKWIERRKKEHTHR